MFSFLFPKNVLLFHGPSYIFSVSWISINTRLAEVGAMSTVTEHCMLYWLTGVTCILLGGWAGLLPKYVQTVGKEAGAILEDRLWSLLTRMRTGPGWRRVLQANLKLHKTLSQSALMQT